MNYLITNIKAFFSTLVFIKESHHQDDEYKTLILETIHQYETYSLIKISKKINNTGKLLYFLERVISLTAILFASELAAMSLLIKIPLGLCVVPCMIEISNGVAAYLLTRKKEYKELEENSDEDIEKSIQSSECLIKALKKMRKLKEQGKTEAEIMHIMEIDNEINNAIDLDYLVKKVTTREELELKMQDKTFSLERKTPLSVKARIELARLTGTLDDVYKLDPRNLTEEDKENIEKKLGTYVDNKENIPFIDYQKPIREIKSDLDSRDLYQSCIYDESYITLYAIVYNNGLIKPYPDDLIIGARNIYDTSKKDGIPFSFKLLISEFSNRNCMPYSWAIENILRSNGHSVRREKSIIDCIELNTSNIENYYHHDSERYMHGVHYYVIETMEDGSEWVYDSAKHLMFEKNFYYAINRARNVEAVPYEVEITKSEKKASLEEKEDIREKLIAFLDREDEYVAAADEKYQEQLRREFAYFKEKLGLAKENKPKILTIKSAS